MISNLDLFGKLIIFIGVMSFIYYNRGMDIELLKNFLILATTKNFTKAAEKVHLSQSALSLQLNKLESYVGRALLNRNNRTVTITPDGEELIAYAQTIIDTEAKMLAHFQETPLRGEVKIGTPEAFATTYLSTILADFIQIYPDIHISVSCDYTQNLIKGFESHEYDLVLIKETRLNPHKNSIKVWDESLSWVCKKSKNFLPPSLQPIPLILSPDPCVYRERALNTLAKNNIPSRIVYTSPSLAGILAAVKAGLGLAILPTYLISSELKKDESLPQLEDAQISLLVQESPTSALKTLAKYMIGHIQPEKI